MALVDAVLALGVSFSEPSATEIPDLCLGTPSKMFRPNLNEPLACVREHGCEVRSTKSKVHAPADKKPAANRSKIGAVLVAPLMNEICIAGPK